MITKSKRSQISFALTAANDNVPASPIAGRAGGERACRFNPLAMHAGVRAIVAQEHGETYFFFVAE